MFIRYKDFPIINSNSVDFFRHCSMGSTHSIEFSSNGNFVCWDIGEEGETKNAIKILSDRFEVEDIFQDGNRMDGKNSS